MKYKKTLLLAALLPAGLSVAATSQAFDVVPAGQPVVTGEPSRVGAPWNHRTSFRIPGTNTDIAFGGYVKLDMLYDFDYDLGDVTTPLALLNPANETDGRTSFSAKQTRLNFRTQTHTDYGTLSTYLEGHFLPDGKFNLRHAYGEYGPFLAGQTWTNFMHFLGTPRLLKLGGPIGYATGRPEQVRYTHRMPSGTFAVALENSEYAISPVPNGPVAAETELPDLTLRYQYGRTFGISGVVRQFSTNDATSDVDEQATGYGIAAQVALPLGDSTTLKGNTMIGTGLGNYLDYTPESISGRRTPNAYLADGSLETVDLRSFGVSLEHAWSADWSSAIGTSRIEQDLPEDIAGFQEHADTIRYSYVNLIWDVTQRLAVGVEYQHAALELVNGESRDANRLQASAQFHF